MNNVEFERSMVDVLVAIIESRGLKHKPVAEKAWPYKKSAYRTWQDMRNGDSPQKLTLRDAHSMAQVLGITMSALCGMVEGRAIAETMKQQADTPLKNAHPEAEANTPARSALPADKQRDGIQPIVGGSSTVG